MTLLFPYLPTFRVVPLFPVAFSHRCYQAENQSTSACAWMWPWALDMNQPLIAAPTHTGEYASANDWCTIVMPVFEWETHFRMLWVYFYVCFCRRVYSVFIVFPCVCVMSNELVSFLIVVLSVNKFLTYCQHYFFI